MSHSTRSNDGSTNGGAFSGIRIVDMSTVVFGPYGSQILADLGAEVIKVEGERGDTMRSAGNPPVRKMGPLYLSLNRNKKSLKLDLKNSAALEAMKRLLASADVFYTNVRAGGLERLGLGYDDVIALNPSIVYVHCTGFGSNGPYAGRLAYDDIVQAASGVTDLIPRVDDGSAPKYIPSLIADKSAGLHAAYATMAGLFHRERTGEGQFIEVPMFEAFTSFNMIENLYDHTFSPPRGDVAYDRSIDRNRKPFETKDGHISIVPYSMEHWQLILSFSDTDIDVISDSRFSSFTERTRNIGILYGLVADLTPSKTTDEWLSLLTELSIPCMRVNHLEDVLHDEHLVATEFFEERSHDEIGNYHSIRHPVHFSKTPASVRIDPPTLGHHSESILESIGYCAEEIHGILSPADQ